MYGSSSPTNPNPPNPTKPSPKHIIGPPSTTLSPLGPHPIPSQDFQKIVTQHPFPNAFSSCDEKLDRTTDCMIYICLRNTTYGCTIKIVPTIGYTTDAIHTNHGLCTRCYTLTSLDQCSKWCTLAIVSSCQCMRRGKNAMPRIYALIQRSIFC